MRNLWLLVCLQLRGFLQSVSRHCSHTAGALIAIAALTKKHANRAENTDCAGSHITHLALQISFWISPTVSSLFFPSLFFFFLLFCCCFGFPYSPSGQQTPAAIPKAALAPQNRQEKPGIVLHQPPPDLWGGFLTGATAASTCQV